MPLEVRELKITGEVSDQSEQIQSRTNLELMSASDKEKLIQTCVDRCVEHVFEILKRNNQK